MAALAFLCSRLLSSTKTTRAVIVIQRAYRNRRKRLEIFQRQMSRRVAEECRVGCCPGPTKTNLGEGYGWETLGKASADL